MSGSKAPLALQYNLYVTCVPYLSDLLARVLLTFKQPSLSVDVSVRLCVCLSVCLSVRLFVRNFGAKYRIVSNMEPV